MSLQLCTSDWLDVRAPHSAAAAVPAGSMKLPLPPSHRNFGSRSEIRAWFLPRIRAAREMLERLEHMIITAKEETHQQALEKERARWERELNDLEQGCMVHLKRFEENERSGKAAEDALREEERIDAEVAGAEAEHLDFDEDVDWEKIEMLDTCSL